nr:immunoglobulin heavy chain junction region [Macaca mulatta]MOW93318.1 immunoglobulin heavy chain junction region [Macaca mulatta]MOW93403.1 immunoglobulin heavy chain junction region [Macaca mulatta]MOW93434.1 immunoglobulin heavy chain junction region [Macaca mulatta]MOW93481.1 immunoglobulin heavy chain junction region [Macaca mulatta]
CARLVVSAISDGDFFDNW